MPILPNKSTESFPGTFAFLRQREKILYCHDKTDAVMEKNTTIKDIAQRLGLSKSTVSRALSDSWEIKQETKDLILKTASEMHYHPNILAKGLVTHKSYTIGVVIPELTTSFFPNIISAIQEIFLNEGYQILITQSNESANVERSNLKLLKQFMVDGIIISTTANSIANADIYQEFQDSGIPIVFFNRVCSEIDTTKIIINDKELACVAVTHLINEGCSNIYHFAGPDKLDITLKRMQGYTDAMQKAGLPVINDAIIHSGIFIDDGERTMDEILDHGHTIPDAVFAFNDPVAIGAIKSAKKHGLRIPEDIAFVGFSESNLATVIEPNLTSIEQPLAKMGETAAYSLLDKLQKKTSYDRTIILDAKFNIRESSMKSNK